MKKVNILIQKFKKNQYLVLYNNIQFKEIKMNLTKIERFEKIYISIPHRFPVGLVSPNYVKDNPPDTDNGDAYWFDDHDLHGRMFIEVL